MSDSRAPTSTSRTTTYAVAATAVFVLYPLSIGPAAWLDKHSIFPRTVMDAILWIYYPLDVLYLKSSHFQKILDWYLELWV